MADALTEIDLDEFENVVEATLAAAFPALKTVAFHHEDRKVFTAPACFLEIAEFETAGVEPDPGTGQLAVIARVEAEIVVGFRTAQAKRQARKLATDLAAFVHLRRWPGVVTGPGEVVGCYKDDFDPRLDQYEVWRIEWAHIVHLGASVWKPDPGAMTPTHVSSRAAHPQGAAVGEQVELVTP